MNLFNHNILKIGLLGFALRVLVVFIFPGPDYYSGISAPYLDAATNLLEGKGITLLMDVAPVSSPTPGWSYEPFIDRPLGYLFLIVVPYWILRTPVAIQIFQALLFVLSLMLLYDCSKRIFSEKTAVVTSLMYAVWPLSIRFEAIILPDAVMPLFLLLTLWMLLQALEKRNTTIWYLGTGLVCGIGMTVRSDILLLPFFLLIWILFQKEIGNRFRSALLVLLGSGIIIGAHAIRNYEATGGKLAPLGLGNGISLWEGISQFGDTLGTVYGDERMSRIEGYRHWAYPNGVERDRKRFSEAVSIISHHPVWYTGMMIKRIPVLLTPDWIMTNRFSPSLKEFLNANSANAPGDYLTHYPIAVFLRVLVILLQYVSLFLALAAFWKQRTNPLVVLPALIIFYYIVIHIPTNTEARYFYPAIPFVLLLASSGWSSLNNRKQ